MWQPRVLMTGCPGEQLWVQTHGEDQFEVGVQINSDQYTYIEDLSKELLTQLRDNINAALLESTA